MAKKDNFWNRTTSGYLLKNVFFASGAFVVFVLLSLLLINIYTKHGRSERVPSLKGLNIEDAKQMLERHNLKAEIIDSVFVKDKKLGTIIEQNPAPNTIVKPGRAIYIIINSKSVRQIPFPNVRDVSLRQAQAILSSIGLFVTDIQYAPSEYRDLVLDALYKGTPLLPGSKISDGSSITLLVGDGAVISNFSAVPSLIGLDYTAATDISAQAALRLGEVSYDEAPNGDESQYVIYQQVPAAGDVFPADSLIHIFLTKNHSLVNTEAVQPSQPPVNQKPVQTKKKEKVKDIEDFF